MEELFSIFKNHVESNKKGRSTPKVGRNTMTMTSKEHIISKADLESQAELKGTGGGIGDGRKRPNTQ